MSSANTRGNEFSDILAKTVLSVEQTQFQNVCPGNKRHEANTISRDGGDLHEFGKLGKLVSAKEAEALV